MNDITEILEHIKGQEKALTGLMEIEAEHISKALKRKNLTTAEMVTLNENLMMILDRLNELSNTTKEKYAMLMPDSFHKHSYPGQREDHSDCIYNEADSYQEEECSEGRSFHEGYVYTGGDRGECCSRNAQMQYFDCNQFDKNDYRCNGCNYCNCCNHCPRNCFSKCSMMIMRF